jgi:hypothetical protein
LRFDDILIGGQAVPRGRRRVVFPDPQAGGVIVRRFELCQGIALPGGFLVPRGGESVAGGDAAPGHV